MAIILVVLLDAYIMEPLIIARTMEIFLLQRNRKAVRMHLLEDLSVVLTLQI